ncbi:MAG TPA: toxin secretion protein [Planctomycetaceae bacterium]|nr:toxin secretion protein [Planctomycetaceae bacterium]|tara:strand:- start:77 stop:1561 length:1485 start_codon:yes stop_codon:yes gene_type:complete
MSDLSLKKTETPTTLTRSSTLLLPVAYDDSVMPSLQLAKSSRSIRRIAKLLFLALLLTIVVVAIAPWQQSIYGSGNVIAFSPDERPQVIESPIKGRIVSWGEGIYENAEVKKGDLIAEIQDLDESYQMRLEQKLNNSERTVVAVEQQLAANKRALEAALTLVDSFSSQVVAYKKVKQETIAAQDAYIEMAKKKVEAETQQLLEYEAAIPQLKAEAQRMEMLYEENNISLQKVQEVKRKLSEAEAKVARAGAYVSSAESELEGKIRERISKIEKAQIDIDYAEATLRKVRGDISKAESDVAKTEQELNKSQKILIESQTDLSRQERQTLISPCDGYVVQINPNMGTAVLKEGDPICTIVPVTSDRAVQIWLQGNDAPLIQKGRHVRLQFEGWPALQFAGWPSVAVGTFGGEVVSIDATDNSKGQFRILVKPVESGQDWPGDRYLRQGVRANGWVILDRVPLWYEIWRRLNGFPVLPPEDGKSSDKNKPKPPKIPK